MALNQFWRSAAGRLAFSYDLVFQDYGRGQQVVGLEWDVWMGFTVVAKDAESEPLVQEIGAWLLKSLWATDG